MAKRTLPTNFKDDILNSSMGGKRRYKLINNSDGTVSLEDASAYDQVGSEYGASQVNAANAAVNASADAGKIIDDIDDINAVTAKGYIAGALALKNVNNSLGGNILSYNESEDAYYIQYGADSVPKKLGSTVNPSLTNAEIAFSSYVSSQTATYTGTIQISSAKVTRDVNVVDMNKMKAHLIYFAYDDNNYGKYNGTYWEYTSSGFIVKQEGDFYVYSNCPGYQRNEIIHCKVGDVIVMLEPRGGAKTDHRNLVIAF